MERVLAYLDLTRGIIIRLGRNFKQKREHNM